jgi:1-acyl-sn-glycerol-3-phosphate acyltransferase
MTTIPFFPTDERDRYRYYISLTPVRAIATFLITRFLIHPVMRIEVRGCENVPLTGPLIISGNHVTNFDVFPMQIATLPRTICFMGKAELFKNPALGWLIRNLCAFPVYRGGGDQWALNFAERVLLEGQTLGIFPEGKRSKGRGLQQAKTGAARFAIAANSPILPLAIIGTDRLFKPWYRPTPVTVNIGKPIYPQADDTADSLTERLMRAIAAMLPEDYRGVYRDPQPV